MSVVLVDPAGFAVDWDWRRGLEVWTLRGPSSESRYGEKVLDHELAAQPPGEGAASRAAREWWRAEGRSQVMERSAPPAG